MRQDLERLRGVWDDFQGSRNRNAIYGYLNAVYGLVAWWAAEGRQIDRARRALRLLRLKISDREDPVAAVIRCTADPARADKRTRSKWSASCGTRRPTSRISSRWATSSSERVASTRARLGFLGGWGEMRQMDREAVGKGSSFRKGSIITLIKKIAFLNKLVAHASHSCASRITISGLRA
jgi:hypothetical protein